ncbi:hypothetical protein SSP24_20350 [Streptomyces spinoverrucosus]|uniref:Uncharacterized protein n=1 Tax=Streptomyces spinoverrucosus TaxID=284043 RepID=A0A4Y3VEZ8_9ACTN|nr:MULTISPECIES: hypothetical protein [Streptomyces]MBX9393555.1 hypothetical protein [Streptomyces sp. TRM72054]GEC04380.1 hypothetical protein SSP24_20350 [Streptomyces spinoverrucosus]GHB48139.1 hypothetical protein GCM10010397_17800 [Streptomyces spinoverrucosus]
MSASTHTRPRPATTGRVDSRLPWWALALPTLAFVVLLALILNPSEAHAASGEPAIAHLVERAHQLISR